MTTPIRSAPGSPGAVWTAAAVARRVGVASGTLRSWSRRYGIGPADHSPGRHRRYTAADVAELDAMCELVAQGMALPAAAAIARSQRAGATATPAPVWTPGRAPGDAVGALVAAGFRLDLDAATGVVAASVDAHGVVATWDGLCLPALGDLDAAVATDLGCTDAQLLLSWAISTCLRRPHSPLSEPDARPVLLACVAGEQHTLGVEALAAALIEHRVPALMLGAAVPSVALLHAARELRPPVVVEWAQRAVTAKPGVLHRLSPLTTAVVAAGPGWQQTVLPAGVSRAHSLSGALQLIMSTHLRS